MLSGLPDRPLSHQELEALVRADALGLVVPATPNSLREDEDGTPGIYDLLISTGETVTAVAYDEGDGWIVVGRTDADCPKEEAVDAVIDYREYEIEDREEVQEFVREIYEATNEPTSGGTVPTEPAGYLP